MQARSQKQNKMGVEHVPKLLIKMALPVMLSMLIQALYNIVDSIFVAQISETALSAVSLAYPVQTMIAAFSVGTGVGVNSLIARRLGEGKQREAERAASNGMFLALITALVFALLGGIFARAFMGVFTSDPVLLDMGSVYVTICAVFSVGLFVQVMCERIMQATGNTIYPMIMQMVGAGLNLILDPILIFGLLGFPAMGVAGAAVATVFGQLAAMGLSLYLMRTKDLEVKVRVRGFRPNGAIIKKIYGVGFPAILMQALQSVMTFGMNMILMPLSTTAVSVYGVYYKLNSFVFLPEYGLTNGAMPIMGYNYGARNKKRLMDTFKFATVYSAGVMFVGMLIFQIFPAQLLGLFNASEEMLAIGVPALRIISIGFIPSAIGTNFSGFFQATGHGFKSLIVSVARQLLAVLPAAYILAQAFGLGGVWFAFPISQVISLTVCGVLFYGLYRKDIRDLGVLPDKERIPDAMADALEGPGA